MIRKALTALVLALSLSVSFGAYADTTDNNSSDREQWMSEMRQYKRTYFIKELGLSKEQQDKFFPIYEALDEQLRQLDDEVRVMEKRVADASDATDLEYEKATEAMYEAKVKQADLEKASMQKFKEILSKKQLFELKGVERQFSRDIISRHQRLRSSKKSAEQK
jgi:Spy/CpxP family protein refolding chaperone